METHSTGDLLVGEGTVCLHPPGKYVKSIRPREGAALGPVRCVMGNGGVCKGWGMVVAMGMEACRRAQRFELVCR